MGASASTISINMRLSREHCPADLLDILHFDKHADKNHSMSVQDIIRSLTIKTDVFLTHDWGVDQKNHKRVAEVNAALKAKGIITWFDDERMEGNIKEKMASGIENARCVMVFITKRYMEKVSGDNDADNCKLEFRYAALKKTASKMLPVVMEASMRNTADWSGEVGLELGGSLYIDMTDHTQFNSKIEELYQRVLKVIGTPLKELHHELEQVLEPMLKLSHNTSGKTLSHHTNNHAHTDAKVSSTTTHANHGNSAHHIDTKHSHSNSHNHSSAAMTATKKVETPQKHPVVVPKITATTTAAPSSPRVVAVDSNKSSASQSSDFNATISTVPTSTVASSSNGNLAALSSTIREIGKQRPQPIRVHCPAAATAAAINGVYLPTQELHNGQVVYRKRDDAGKVLVFMHMSLQWVIKPASEEGAWATLSLEREMPLEEAVALETLWKYIDKTEWIRSADMKVFIPSMNPIRITCPSGPTANTINGIYEPSEEVSNGASIYYKLGDPNKIIEYMGGDVKQWQVKPSSRKGEINAWAAYNVPGPGILPEYTKEGVWKVYEEGEWHPRTDIMVDVVALQSLVLNCSTGSTSSAINGIYDPSTDTSYGASIYYKRGDRSKIIEFYGGDLNQWQVKPLEKQGTPTSWATLSLERVILPEYCSFRPWKVFENPIWHEMPDFTVQVTSNQAIYITAPGKLGQSITGAYIPTNEMYHNITVYRKATDPQICIEYGGGNLPKWQIKPEEKRGSSASWASLACDAMTLLERCHNKTWKIFEDGQWKDKNDIMIHIAVAQPIHIFTSFGNICNTINGLYEPTNEVSHGVMMYKGVRDPNIIIEYNGTQWQIKPADKKGTNTSWANCPIHPPQTLEHCMGRSWKLFDQGSWHERSDVIVAVGAVHNIEVSGATGSFASTLNGVYEPTVEVSNGVIIFHKRGDANKIMEYMGGKIHQWQIKPGDKKGSTAAWATLSCEDIVLPHLVFGKHWRVCSESTWLDMPSIKLKLC